MGGADLSCEWPQHNNLFIRRIKPVFVRRLLEE